MSAEQPESERVTVSHARRRPSRAWLGWVASITAGVLGFSLVYANTLVDQVDDAWDAEDVNDLVSEPPTTATTSPDPEDAFAGQALNILLMGSDTREGENGDIGGRVTDGMRNDTTIVMHISADRSRVDLVSIPRDAQVEIPTCKLRDGTEMKGRTADFNVAFAHGGSQGDPAEAAACVINTVQKMSGLTIDHWAVIDFAGFITMIDALGGVPMCIPEKVVSKKAKLNLEAGPQVLTGKQALALARMRTAEVGDIGGSDLNRIGRQQDLMMQVLLLAMSKNFLTDAGELTQFLRAGAESLTMDTEMADTRYLLGLAFSLRNIDPQNINFETIPWKLTDDYLNVIITPGAEIMWDDMRHDRPLTRTGDSSGGEAWDEANATTPKAVTGAEDPAEALLDLCA